METVRNEGAKKNYFVPLIFVLVLIILVLLFFISPLSDLVFPPDTEPSLVLAVVEKIGPDPATGLYRIVVEAQVEGKPEPQVNFNRNDGMGQVEANRALLMLEEDETFLLKAIASNPRGTAEAELELFGGIMVGITAEPSGPSGSPGPGGSGAPGPGNGGGEDDPGDDDLNGTDPPDGDDDEDDDGEDEEDVPANQPPAVSGINFSDSPLRTRKTYTATASASDPDGDTLSYSWVILRVNRVIERYSGNPIEFNAPNSAGSYIIKVTVSDGRGGETNYSETIVVLP